MGEAFSWEDFKNDDQKYKIKLINFKMIILNIFNINQYYLYYQFIKLL